MVYMRGVINSVNNFIKCLLKLNKRNNNLLFIKIKLFIENDGLIYFAL